MPLAYDVSVVPYKDFLRYCLDLLYKAVHPGDRQFAKRVVSGTRHTILVKLADRILMPYGGLAAGCATPTTRLQGKKTARCYIVIEIRADLVHAPDKFALTWVHEFGHAMQHIGIAEASARYYGEIAAPTEEFAEEHAADMERGFAHMIMREAAKHALSPEAFIWKKGYELGLPVGEEPSL